MTHYDPRPIGIFDSGVGGLTVARALVARFPGESIHYIGDTAHAPYGPRPTAEVRALAGGLVERLAARGCKMVVIACNTATAAYLPAPDAPIPVIGVIAPTAARALAATRTGRIGVIGTAGTIASGAYTRALNLPHPVPAVACPQFVPFVERGITTGRQILGLASAYLEPLQDAAVDTLILGCTHYPLLADVIQVVMGPDVTLVNSGDGTADAVARQLVPAPPGHTPTRTFESTGDPLEFARLATRFLGPDITAISTVDGTLDL